MTVRKQWSRRWQCEGYSLCIDRRGGLLGHSVQFSALKFAHEPRCEVEVMASANDGDSKFTVQAVAILQANSPKPWTLDKNKLTALFKAELPFAFKLTKRAVDKAELASVIQDAAVASSSMIASSSSSE